MRAPEILVTIAIPTRNRPSGLRAALESALKQSYSNLEIIVSDNNTDGDMKPVVEGFHDPRIKYFRHTRTLEMTGNWNFCLGKATGEYFILLSDDDFLFPGAVAGLQAALKDRRLALSYGRAVFKDESGREVGISSSAPENEAGRDFILKSLSGKRQALPSFTLFRTAEARGLGGYPETGNSTDLALRLSLALSGAVFCSRKPLGVYTLHSGSLTGDVDKTIDSFGLLAGWSADPASPLAGWSGAVRRYCAASLRARARAAALRGDSSAVRKLTAKASELFPSRWPDNIVLRILAWPLVRGLAALRRKLLQDNG